MLKDVSSTFIAGKADEFNKALNRERPTESIDNTSERKDPKNIADPQTGDKNEAASNTGIKQGENVRNKPRTLG